MILSDSLFLVEFTTTLTQVIRACQTACNSWIFIYSTRTFYRLSGHLLTTFVDMEKLQEIVDREEGSEPVNTFCRNPVLYLALWASDTIFISGFFHHVLETTCAVDVETRENFWVLVPGQTNGAGQLLVDAFCQGFSLLAGSV